MQKDRVGHASAGVLFVTGGSRGIGAAVASMAARAGYDVALCYRERADQAAAVVADIESVGARALALKVDLSNLDAVVQAFEKIDEFGRLSVLVNNAGIIGARLRLQDLELAMLEQVFRVNTLATLLACREAVRRMSSEFGGGGGSIINVSSGAAVTGAPNTYIHYAATKGAMDSLTIGLSKEVGPFGIRVNAVRPGLIATDIQADRTSEQVERMQAMVPLRRFGTAKEVAHSILWLASEAASYVNGALIDVRGG
jgi:NAD(P)-dependent dehydrogenase (short-subunit alcohol dehydrogenase family)